MLTYTYKTIVSTLYVTLGFKVLSFFISVSLYFLAFYKHFVVLVQKIDDSTIEVKDLENSSAARQAVLQHEKGINAKKVLADIVRFHIIVKE